MPPSAVRLLTEEQPAVTRSQWLSDTTLLREPLSSLTGTIACDVAIVGGGYVGLWTAIELKQRDPALRVVILEQDVCGGGASGRNGGQVHSWADRLDTLVTICGADEALRLVAASQAAIDELEQLQREGLDVGLRRDGWVQTAATEAQLGSWDHRLRVCANFGLSPYETLGPDELRAKTGSEGHRAGVIERSGGTVHPGRLVAALRARALDAGVQIYERTPVRSLHRERGVLLRGPAGEVEAARVVLATGAWASALPELRRRLFVVASDMLATAPVPERLAEIGWTGGAALCDSETRVHYFTAAADGRVMFGQGAGRIAAPGHVGRRLDSTTPRLAAEAAAALARLCPGVAGVPIERAWSGPIDRTLAGLPIFGDLDGHGDVFYGVGWSGTGVAQSRIGGRILASLAQGADDEWSRSALVGQSERRFPPEPARFLGAHVVLGAHRRKSRIEAQGRRPDLVTRLVSDLNPTLAVADDPRLA